MKTINFALVHDVITIPAIYNNIKYFLLVQRRDLLQTYKLHVTALTEAETKIYGAYVFEVRNETFCLISQPRGSCLGLTEAIVGTVKKNITGLW